MSSNLLDKEDDSPIEMMTALKINEDNRKMVAAIVLIILWVVAWINYAWLKGPEVPWPLNVGSAVAWGTLLGASLPIDIKRK